MRSHWIQSCPSADCQPLARGQALGEDLGAFKLCTLARVWSAIALLWTGSSSRSPASPRMACGERPCGHDEVKLHHYDFDWFGTGVFDLKFELVNTLSACLWPVPLGHVMLYLAADPLVWGRPAGYSIHRMSHDGATSDKIV